MKNVIQKSKPSTDEISNQFSYGKVTQSDNTGKPLKFTVTHHLEADKKYKFRYTAKCRAGFLTISETNYDQTPEAFIGSNYAFLENVQVWIDAVNPSDNYKGLWVNVLTTKGKKFYSIDKHFLLNLTVGNMHNAWKKMVDYDLWKKMGTKTHADYPYKMNTTIAKEAVV